MMEQFDATERQFGIDAYASPHDGFAAVMKGRYSDFIVQEVGEDGTVALLDSIIYQEAKNQKQTTRSNGDKEEQGCKKIKVQDEKKVLVNNDKLESDNVNSDNINTDVNEESKEKDEPKKEINETTRKEEHGEIKEKEEQKKEISKGEEEHETKKCVNVAKDEIMDTSTPENEIKPKDEKEKNNETPSNNTTTSSSSSSDPLNEAQSSLAPKAEEEHETKKCVNVAKDDVMDTSTPENEIKPKDEKEKNNETPSNNTTTSSSSSSDPLNEAQSSLAPLVGPTAAADAISILRHWSLPDPPTTTPPTPKNYTFPIVTDKTKRQTIHLLIRGPLIAPHALAETTSDKRIRLWPLRFRKEMATHGSFPRRNRKGGRNNKRGREEEEEEENEEELKKYDELLCFVLYKENMDTATAIREIQRRLRNDRVGRRQQQRGRGGRGQMIHVGYAGMKDKRGVTSQFCSLRGIEPSRLTDLNGFRPNPRKRNNNNGKNSSSGSGRGNDGTPLLRIGKPHITTRDLRLGNLSGNRFTVVLRNVSSISTTTTTTTTTTKSSSSPLCNICTTAANSFATTGFINYFGLQRFGKFGDTHRVGIALLKSDFETAVDIVMREKADGEEKEIYRSARRLWSRRFDGIEDDEEKRKRAEAETARMVLSRLGRFFLVEVALLQHLSRKPLDYEGAFRHSVPKNTTLMFLHAFQSYLWNDAASRRAMMQQKKKSVGGEVEGEEAKRGTIVPMVGDLVLLGDGREETGRRATGRKGKSVKILNDDDVREGTYDVSQIVLPLVGSKVTYPTYDGVSVVDDVLKEHGLTTDHLMHKTHAEYSLGGDYRHFMCKPKDVTFEMKEYHDPLESLVDTELMRLGKMDDLKAQRRGDNSGEEKPPSPDVENNGEKPTPTAATSEETKSSITPSTTTNNTTNEETEPMETDPTSTTKDGNNSGEEKPSSPDVESNGEKPTPTPTAATSEETTSNMTPSTTTKNTTNEETEPMETDPTPTTKDDGCPPPPPTPSETNDKPSSSSSPSPSPPTPLLGMIITFTLPPSSYATIALRELMKRPTGSAYQKMLKLDGGSCERQQKKEDDTDTKMTTTTMTTTTEITTETNETAANDTAIKEQETKEMETTETEKDRDECDATKRPNEGNGETTATTTTTTTMETTTETNETAANDTAIKEQETKEMETTDTTSKMDAKEMDSTTDTTTSKMETTETEKDHDECDATKRPNEGNVETEVVMKS